MNNKKGRKSGKKVGKVRKVWKLGKVNVPSTVEIGPGYLGLVSS